MIGLPTELVRADSELARRFGPLFDRHDDADWQAVYTAARGPRSAETPPRRATWRWAAISCAAVLAALMAMPAFGLRGLIVSFLSSPPAPPAVVSTFSSLDNGAPAALAPQALPSAARLAHQFQLPGGRTVSLWLAPTKSGGYCAYVKGFFEGCRDRSDIRISFGLTPTTEGGLQLAGDVPRESGATAVDLIFKDGSRESLPLVWISAPIAAGFYVDEINPDSLNSGKRPVEVIAVNANGDEVSSQTLPSQSSPPGR